MKTTLRRTLIAFASVALATGLAACGDEESTDGPSRGDADAGADSGRGGDGTDTDAGGNPSLNDVGIGGEDAGGTPDGGGAEDGLSCLGVVTCINGTDGSDAALEACVVQGTPAAQSLLNDLLACGQANCASAQSEQEIADCQREFCSAEIAACQADDSGGTVEPPVGSTGAYESCNTEPCGAGMQCGSFDGANNYCFPECGVGGACTGWEGGGGICGVGFEGGSQTPTHCLPTCTDTDASSDCPDGWSCISQQGVTVCQP